MRLTTFSDYSLRVLIYLGLSSPRLTTIAEIAQAYGISKNHLMKVVQHLGNTGYVETVRGKKGGLRLQKDPSEIRLGDVLRATEDDVVIQCLAPTTDSCRIITACVLPRVFQEATEAFFATVDRYTLADLLVTRPNLGLILGVPVTMATPANKEQ